MTELSEYQRMVTKERTPTPRPWPDIIYDNNIDPTLEVEDGSWPSLGEYTEWWEIPGIARFEREADAYLVLDTVNSARSDQAGTQGAPPMSDIEKVRAALDGIGALLDLLECSNPANLALLPLFLAELKRALAALARMEPALIRTQALEEAAKVIEDFLCTVSEEWTGEQLLAALRALKDQP